MNFLRFPPSSSHSPVQSSHPSKPISIPRIALPLSISPPLPSSSPSVEPLHTKKYSSPQQPKDACSRNPIPQGESRPTWLTRLKISSPLNREARLSPPPIFKTLSTKSPSPKTRRSESSSFKLPRLSPAFIRLKIPPPLNSGLPPLPRSLRHISPITQTAFPQPLPKISQHFPRPLPGDPISSHHNPMPAPGISFQLPKFLNDSTAQRIQDEYTEPAPEDRALLHRPKIYTDSETNGPTADADG